MIPNVHSRSSLTEREEFRESIISTKDVPVSSANKTAILWSHLDAFDSQISQYIEHRDAEHDFISGAIQTADDLTRKRKTDLREGFVKKITEFKLHQTNIENFYQIELQRKNDYGKKVNDLVHEKICEVSNTMHASKAKSKSLIDQYKAEKDSGFADLRENIESIKDSQGDIADTMENRTVEYFEHIQNLLEAEVREREDNQNSTYELFKSVIKNFEKKLEEEKTSRDRNLNEILNLLEDACLKLESASL
jgi:hypothetical protein